MMLKVIVKKSLPRKVTPIDKAFFWNPNLQKWHYIFIYKKLDIQLINQLQDK